MAVWDRERWQSVARKDRAASPRTATQPPTCTMLGGFQLVMVCFEPKAERRYTHDLKVVVNNDASSPHSTQLIGEAFGSVTCAVFTRLPVQWVAP